MAIFGEWIEQRRIDAEVIGLPAKVPTVEGAPERWE